MSYTLQGINKLGEKEKEIALKILKELSEKGNSQLYNDLLYSDYEEIPVDIETFLYDPKYLGSGLIDPEGRMTVFPYWIEKLKEIFPDNISTRYNTLVLTGSIGLGKSFVAVVCMLYLLYRMLCLKDPYLYYGLQPIDKITFSLINITLDAAKGVAWDKLQQLVQTSSWFLNHGKLVGREYLQWQPGKSIELIMGSRNNHIIGRAVYCNFTDEVNFGVGNDVEKLKQKQKTLISQVDARMQSRFMKGTKLPTLNIIASSKRSEQSFLETYIDMKRKNENKTTLIVDEPQWVVRNDKGSPDDPGSFYVAIGNRFRASELIPPNASEEEIDNFRKKGYQLLKVPAGYYQNFLEDIDIALTDIAGVSSSNSMKYISGERWEDLKNKNILNPFIKDIIEVGTAKDDLAQYSDFFDLKRVPIDLMSKPMYIHLDMSTSGDKTGIAGVWIKAKKPSVEGVDSSKELYYRLAFSVSIQAPKGYQISYEKNRNFIRWLKEQGFNIKGISADTFASPQILQQLASDGFNTKVISVDRIDPGSKVCLPYHTLKVTINERRLEIYDRCDLLTTEIIGLERLSNGKIEHPDEGRSGSKDQADAVCGALFNASQNGEQFAFDYGETLETIVDANNSNFEAEKEQLQISFQEELQKMFNPLAIQQNIIEQNQSNTKNNVDINNLNEAKFNDSKKEEIKKPAYMDFGLGPSQVLNGQSYIQDGILWW